MLIYELSVVISGLTKSFGATRALDGLNLTVRVGEVHGFLGPNGSGKSTTLRILLGLVRADGGTAELLGGDPWRSADELHRRLAYVPGDVDLWPNLSGGEVIDLLGRAERAEGVRIFIGSENKLFSLSGSSTIIAPYSDAAGHIVGVLGVIGPTRLNYARVIPTVDYAARIVSRMLGG